MSALRFPNYKLPKPGLINRRKANHISKTFYFIFSAT